MSGLPVDIVNIAMIGVISVTLITLMWQAGHWRNVRSTVKTMMNATVSFGMTLKGTVQYLTAAIGTHLLQTQNPTNKRGLYIKVNLIVLCIV